MGAQVLFQLLFDARVLFLEVRRASLEALVQPLDEVVGGCVFTRGLHLAVCELLYELLPGLELLLD